MRTIKVAVLALGVMLLGSAEASAKASAGPPPLPLPTPKKKKPKKVTAPTPVGPTAPTGPTDCSYSLDSRSDPGDGGEAEKDERDIPGAKSDNNAGLRVLRDAEAPGVDPMAKRKMWVEAVRILLDGLEKDPYNPNINYNLAAAYARLAKRGCMLKFVKRVVALTKRRETQEQATLRITHLTKGFPGEKPPRPADPDFNDYRDDPDFRAIVYDEAGQND